MSLDKVRTEFDGWAERGTADRIEEAHGDVARQVIDALDVAPGEKILDLGCGNGWATRLLAQKNAGTQAIGLDVSPKMIQRAEELHSFTIRARYDLGNFESLDFEDGEFSRIFSMEALYYTVDLHGTLTEALRVLQPGGSMDVLIDCYREVDAAAGWSEALGLELVFLGEDEWKGAFIEAGFTNVEIRRVIDSRGAGDEASFTPSACGHPTWESRVQAFEQGTLWIHAEKPA